MAGLLTFFATLSIIGSVFYYTVGLTPVVVGVVTVGTIAYLLMRIRALPTFWQALRQGVREQWTFFLTRPYVSMLASAFLGLLIAAFAILATHPITDAVRSPWDRIPAYFFLVFFIAAIIGITLLYRLQENPSRIPAIILASLFLSPILLLATIVFPLGYGFDSFIHQATEKLIAANGAVTPKPLYYIGQYSLVVLLSKFLFIPIEWIDKLLVPVLAIILIPWSITRWCQKQDILHSALCILGILILPFFLSQFTITTPQALANLFLIILILLESCNVKRETLWLLAIAIILIHPLAGIPAFIFLVLRYLQTNKSYVFHVTCYVFAVLAIPISFLLAAQFSSQIHVTFAPQNFLPWLQSIEWTGIYRENRFHAPFDILYFYAFNIKNIFWFFVITGLLSWWKKRKIASCFMLHASCFLVLLASYVLMRGFLSFEFLIGYEQADYANRVLEIAYLFLLPFFLVGFGWWVKKIWKLAPIGCAILLTLLVTASLYLTYPQNVDSYAVSHGFNTSASDIETVQWIEANAEGEPYIVLANQAVSAAAVHEFGFKKYYGPHYFYPIPTGSPLYQDYLDMVYKDASHTTIERAMDRVGVDRAYFVLNRYWVNFSQIKKEALASADTSHIINDQDFIFEYHRAR